MGWCSNNDAFTIAIFLIQSKRDKLRIEIIQTSPMKPGYKLLDILSVFRSPCIMSFSRNTKFISAHAQQGQALQVALTKYYQIILRWKKMGR